MATLHDTILKHAVQDLGPLPAPRLPPTASVQEALQMLMRARRGAIVVLDGTKPTGIFTERDVVYRLPAALYPSREERRRTPLARVMTANPVTVERRTGLAEALRRMATGGHRHLVVVDDQGDLAGLLNANDIVQFLTDQFPEETMHLPPRLHQHYHRRGGA